LVNWQCHTIGSDLPWHLREGDCLRGDPSLLELRQVVVAESPAPDELPVVDAPTLSGDPYIVTNAAGVFLTDPTKRTHVDLTDEPWAANLRPGDTVRRFTPTLLDVPITTMVEFDGDTVYPETIERTLPLSLVEGQPTIIEVTDG
jgi:hypothetical protein